MLFLCVAMASASLAGPDAAQALGGAAANAIGAGGWLDSVQGVLASQLQNDFLRGGFVLAAMASVWALIAYWASVAWERYKKRWYTTVVIESKHPNFQMYSWILRYLAKTKGVEDTNHVRASYKSQRPQAGNQGHFAPQGGEDEHEEIDLIYRPLENYVFAVEYEDRTVWAHFNSKREGSGGDSYSFDTVTLTVFGENKDLIGRMIKDARAEYYKEHKGFTSIQVVRGAFGDAGRRRGGHGSPAGDAQRGKPSRYRRRRRGGLSWQPLASRPSRPLESVILAQDNEAAHIVQDAKDFLANASWYYDRGIPWRRGYLLYGNPGCGKTSFLTALAGELGVTICIISLSSPGLNDQCLNQLFNSAPQRAILLLEDVDAAFDDRSTLQKKNEPAPPQDGGMGMGMGMGGDPFGRNNQSQVNSLSFSGLLNAIDGVAAAEGRLLFMTTNYIDKLDDALIRPGRVDIRCKFDLATSEQAGRLFAHFFQDHYKSDPGLTKVQEDFQKRIPHKKYSMAKIQGFLMSHRNDPRKVLSGMNKLEDAEELSSPFVASPHAHAVDFPAAPGPALSSGLFKRPGARATGGDQE